jgi:hypothetical protein
MPRVRYENLEQHVAPKQPSKDDSRSVAQQFESGGSLLTAYPYDASAFRHEAPQKEALHYK